MFIRIVLAGVALALAGCATGEVANPKSVSSGTGGAEQKSQLLVGRWYGEYDDKDNGSVQFLSEREPDGTYVAEFQWAEGVQQYEQGKWGVDRDTYWTRYESWTFARGPDEEWYPAEPPTRDEYRILALSQDVFEYEHRTRKTKFKATRVTGDFIIPLAPEEEVIAATTVVPASLTAENAGYMDARATELLKQFEFLCVESGTDASEISERASELGWSESRRSQNDETTEWTSISDPDDFNTKLPLILTRTVEVGSVSCGLSVFGTTSDPVVARQEVDIMRDKLAPSYSVGETVESKTGRPAMYVFRTQFLKHADEREFFHNWIGGLHTLVATENGA